MLSQLQKEAIQAFAQHSMNASETARSLYIHRNTLAYHFERIKQRTNLDPLNFYDLVELVKMAEEY